MGYENNTYTLEHADGELLEPEQLIHNTIEYGYSQSQEDFL